MGLNATKSYKSIFSIEPSSSLMTLAHVDV